MHLWAGLALGLYIAVACVSGSAIVFRNDLYDIFVLRMKVAATGPLLSTAELGQALERTHPGYTLRSVKPGRDGAEASEATLSRGIFTTGRLVNPYTGADLGPALSGWFRILRWWGDLHGNLFLGSQGMTANAIGGGLTAALCMTGLVIWWPGVATWRRGLMIRGGVGWKRLTWDLHGMVGFWTFALLFMWGLTAFYFVFPQPFRAAIEYFTPINPPPSAQVQRAPQPAQGAATFTIPRRRRPLTLGGKILRGFSLAHYGNFMGWKVKALWVLLGLSPVALYITALIMWWNRVLWPALLRARRLESISAPSRA